MNTIVDDLHQLEVFSRQTEALESKLYSNKPALADFLVNIWSQMLNDPEETPVRITFSEYDDDDPMFGYRGTIIYNIHYAGHRLCFGHNLSDLTVDLEKSVVEVKRRLGISV